MMLKVAFKSALGASPRNSVANISIIANALIWYFYAFNFLLSIAENNNYSSQQNLLIWGPSFLGIALSALSSAVLIEKLSRRTPFILGWMTAGIFLSLIPLGINIAQFEFLVTYATLVGVYFGIGIPVCLGYFAAATEPANRSRLSGVAFLTTFLGFLILGALGHNDIVISSLLLAACKGIGLSFLVLLKPDGRQISQNDRTSYVSIIRNRQFLLYFLPWLMFSLVNYLAIPINEKVFPQDVFHLTAILENVLAAAFAVVFGFVADYMGRKRITVVGFSLLGLGYAALGLVPRSTLGLWFYTIVDGVAWGAFYTIFVLTLWGDLAQGKDSEKHYAIGSLPFLLSNFLRISIGDYIGGIAETAIFSFASLFLFLAVLPLIYAPETLPEKIMKDRDLKMYLEKAQKIAEKAQKKDENKEEAQEEKEETSVEFGVPQEETEEAEKLAEKYY